MSYDRNCPHCRSDIPLAATKCRYCGSAVEPIEVLTEGEQRFAMGMVNFAVKAIKVGLIALAAVIALSMLAIAC